MRLSSLASAPRRLVSQAIQERIERRLVQCGAAQNGQAAVADIEGEHPVAFIGYPGVASGLAGEGAGPNRLHDGFGTRNGSNLGVAAIPALGALDLKHGLGLHST